MEKIREILAENLVRLRGKMTQSELCDRANISLRYYSDIETSKKKWPQPDKLEALAAALGASPEDLFWTHEMEKKLSMAVREYEKYLQWYPEMQADITQLQKKLENLEEESKKNENLLKEDTRKYRDFIRALRLNPDQLPEPSEALKAILKLAVAQKR